MADEQRYRLRVTYVKSGRAAMLSHLEICRALERCVRRAALPYAISNGFSPHMRIAFGAALPVGVGGDCEIFDVLLTERISEVAALAALRAASVADLLPHACSYIDAKAAAASVAYPFHTYRFVFDCLPEKLVIPETVTVIRKKKEKTLVVADFICGDVVADKGSVVLTLHAKPTGSLRADVLAAALQQENPGLQRRTITRIEQREAL